MQSSEFKNLLWDVLSNTDDVDERGLAKPRTTYKRNLIRGVQQTKKAIKDQLEITIVKAKLDKDGNVLKDEKPDEKKISFNEWMTGKYQGWAEKQQTHTDKNIEFTDKMKEAVRFYYNEREELPSYVDEKTLDEFEGLIL